MLKFNLGYHELHINEDLVSGKIVFNDDKKRKKSQAKAYLEDFFTNFIEYHDISIYDDTEAVEVFYETLVCKSFSKNILTFEVDYFSRSMLYQICNHFYTFVKTTDDKFFASKKYTFDCFKVQNVKLYEDNKEVVLASNYYEYTIHQEPDGGIWYLSDISETEGHEYASLYTKLEALKFDLSRFTVDNKCYFDLKHLPKIYSDMVIKPLLTSSSIYTDNMVAEKSFLFNHIVNTINNDKKVNNNDE